MDTQAGKGLDDTYQQANEQEDVAYEARLADYVSHSVRARNLIVAQRCCYLLRAQLGKAFPCRLHSLLYVDSKLDTVLQEHQFQI